MNSSTPLDRRRFLALGGLVGGAVVASSALPALGRAEAATLPRWSDPATWGGRVPASGAPVVLRKAVLLDVDVRVASLTVAAGAALVLDPARSRTVTSRGNVVVEGLLQMRPRTAAVVHLLRFEGVDEARFVGGGMGVLASDVGLWVRGAGVLDVAGTPRRAWARTDAGLRAGTQTLRLAADPVGWRVGDELAITPTGSPATAGHALAYDYAKIRYVSGRTVTLTAPTRFAHPAVPVGPGMSLTPEVLNLTRNVRLEGTPTGRAHVWMSPSSKQNLSYFAVRWMGPRQADAGFTTSVLGRYGLHLHMAGDRSRGTQVAGAVVRDTGGHAFVAHVSHGVRFTSCISHDTMDDAYWWDGSPDTRTPGSESHDVSYEGCVASLVRCDPPFRGYRLTGFALGAGTGNAATDCVAVGVQGSTDASGYLWPEGARTGVWAFARSTAHNNAAHGIFTWQNTTNAHVVEDFVCYHNGGAGVSHGAYVNGYTYRNGFLYGNRAGALLLHSHARPNTAGGLARFEGLHCDGAGIAQHAVVLAKHTLDSPYRTTLEACRFTGHTDAAVAAVYDGSNGPTMPERLDLVDCVASGTLVRLHDTSPPTSSVRVQTGATAYELRPKGQVGRLAAGSNAVTNAIAPFATPRAAQPRSLSLVQSAVLPAVPQTALSASSTLLASAGHTHPTTSATQTSGGVTAELVPGAVGRPATLLLVNGGASACTVRVSFAGRRISEHRAAPGRVRVRLPHLRGEGVLEASCHTARLRWYLPA